MLRGLVFIWIIVLGAALSAPLARAQSVDVTDSAIQLLDFGESRFPEYFPRRRSNLSFAPFLYRYYPESGVYLGVAVAPDPAYIQLGVYVLGGLFGDTPMYVGLLSDYITPVVSSGAVQTRTIAGFSNSIDFFVPDGSPTRALIYLHGGAGTNYNIANAMGYNTRNDPATTALANWPWIKSNRVIGVFPQGQAIDAEPNARTWSNHAMTSGQDDVAFLQALAAHVRATYGVTRLAIAGHSMGGAMVQRMWCESPDTFDAYISMAGPASRRYLDAATPCNPGTHPPPYLGLFAGSDSVIQNTGKWEAETWQVAPLVVAGSARAWLDSVLAGEWQMYRRRAALMCGADPQAAEGVVLGDVVTWSHCNGRVKLLNVRSANHPMSSIEEYAGLPLADLINQFVDGY